MSQPALVHEAGLEAVWRLNRSLGLVGHTALVQGLLADCPGHFGLHTIACVPASVIVHMTVHGHGLVGRAEPVGGGCM